MPLRWQGASAISPNRKPFTCSARLLTEVRLGSPLTTRKSSKGKTRPKTSLCNRTTRSLFPEVACETPHPYFIVNCAFSEPGLGAGRAYCPRLADWSGAALYRGPDAADAGEGGANAADLLIRNRAQQLPNGKPAIRAWLRRQPIGQTDKPHQR